MYEVVTASTLKKDLLGILKKAEGGESFLVIRKSKPSAYLINAEDFESLLETVKLCNNKDFLKKLAKEDEK